MHNGIITNHSDIKNQYLSGTKFSSETDTEIIIQFISSEVRKGKTVKEALELFSEIAGKESQWGMLIIDREQSDRIYTSTNGSPMLVGFGYLQDQIFIVS